MSLINIEQKDLVELLSISSIVCQVVSHTPGFDVGNGDGDLAPMIDLRIVCSW